MPLKNKKKILIVEDEKEVQDIYKTKFKKKGYKILLADSGTMGIDLAMREKPDLILLDLILPLKEGFVVLKALKSNPKTKNIPVVILSNLDQDYEIKMGKNLGAESYLTKVNTTPDDVVRAVEEILGRE